MIDCPSCGGPATEALKPHVLEYGEPAVGLPYICPTVNCPKCGDFIGEAGMKVRAEVVEAWESVHAQNSNVEKP